MGQEREKEELVASWSDGRLSESSAYINADFSLIFLKRIIRRDTVLVIRYIACIMVYGIIRLSPTITLCILG